MTSTRTDDDQPNFGTYVLDGVTRVAQSLEHAVKYEYQGWSKTGDAQGDAVGTTTPVAPAPKSSGATSKTSTASSGSSTS